MYEIVESSQISIESRRDNDSRDENQGVLAKGMRSLAYTALQEPLNGITEIASKTVDRDLLPGVQFIDPGESSKFGSRDWHVDQVASAVGIAVNFLLLRKAGKAVLKNGILGKSAGRFNTATRIAESRTLSSALTGAAYEGVFRPSGSEGSFIGNRLQHALEGGLTFGGMAGTSKLLKGSAARRLGAYPGVQKVLGSEIATHSLAGVPVGAGRAQLTSVLDGNGAASVNETVESAYSYFLVGGTMAGLGTVGRTLREGKSRALEPARLEGKDFKDLKGLKDLRVLVIEDAQGFRKPIVNELANHGIKNVTQLAGVERLTPDHITGIKPGKNAEPMSDSFHGNKARVVELDSHKIDVALVDGDFIGRVKSGELVIPELKKSGVPIVIAISGGGAGNPVLVKAGADMAIPKELVKPLIKEGKLEIDDLARHPDHIAEVNSKLPKEIEALRKRMLAGEDLGSLDLSD